MCENPITVSAAQKTEGCAVGQPRSRVGGIGSGVHMRQVAAAKQAGSETLGEWMDRHELTRDQVAARLTKGLGKPISAKAIVLYRNRPAPRSWREALAKSEHAPHEVGRQPAPQGRTRALSPHAAAQ
jgi:site-specific recombinase XerC